MKSLKGSLPNARLFAITMAVMLAVVTLGLWGFISVSYADGNPDAPYTLDTGYLDFAFGEEVESDHTGSRPESKLWWNDGYWWGSLWNDQLNEFHIYRLNWGTQTWQDTGVTLDDRPESRADVLWDEASNKLYVASYFQQDNPSQVNDSVNWGRLYRFTYDEAAESYTLDSGFPVNVNEDKTNSLVIDKDSAGRLWTTYVSRRPQQGIEEHQVYVNATTSPSADDSWETPFSLATLFPEAYVDVEDIASIVAFDNTVGVMWSNQLSETLNFAVHDPAEPFDSGWIRTTVPISGTADDHISLKADGSGRLFAAIKSTTGISDTEPLIGLVTRSTTGDFSYHEYSNSVENDTRPILLIDEGNNQVYIFVTGKPGGSHICYKTAEITSPLSNMAFLPGDCGTLFIGDDAYSRIDSATTTKQNVNATTGLAVLASDDHNGNVYVHNVSGDPLPVVTNRSPGPGDVNVPVETEVAATFSHEMNEATLTSGFTLESAGGSVPGSVSYDNTSRTATFTPNAPLNANTVYTASLTAGVQDTGGRPLFEPESWNFTTAGAAVGFASAEYSVLENEGSAPVTVTLSAPSSISVTVDYATSNGTAEAGSDYTAASGTLTFAPGEVSKSFNVPITDDGDDETNETVNLALSNPVNAGLGTSAAVLNIVDDEGDPTVQFQPPAPADEGAGTATVSVILSHASLDTVTVDYATSNGTATSGSDYNAASGTLTFAPGETTKTFAVTILEDTMDEPDETVNLSLSNPTNAELGMPGNTATLNITDNDAPPKVAFSMAGYSVDEDVGTASITVNLSAASGRQVTVDYATSAGTATVDNDYTPTSGTLTFNAGDTSETFTVPILDDILDEPDETVQLVLSNPNNATLGTPSSATLTIVNNDYYVYLPVVSKP